MKKEPMFSGSDDEFDADLAGLPVRDADPARVAAIRARCLAALARAAGGRPARPTKAGRWLRRMEVLAASGLAAVFLAAVVERVLEILR